MIHILIRQTWAILVADDGKPGFGRDTNQDAGWAAPATCIDNRDGQLMVVTDAIGCHKGGDYASHYTCDALSDYYRTLPKQSSPSYPVDLGLHLAGLIFRIDRRLRFKAHQNQALWDMSTTLSCLVLAGIHSTMARFDRRELLKLTGYGAVGMLAGELWFFFDLSKSP